MRQDPKHAVPAPRVGHVGRLDLRRPAQAAFELAVDNRLVLLGRGDVPLALGQVGKGRQCGQRGGAGQDQGAGKLFHDQVHFVQTGRRAPLSRGRATLIG